MGLFPVRGRLRSQVFRRAPSRAGEVLRGAAVAATNDARIVAVLLLLAAVALAWEMATSVKP
ncbi:MAG: hypothetical protein E6I84_10325 [Chloroflexi bacterium]|nr:MAG: hypothetical protein E6J32_01540 [Chloroflexota bacterium]TMD65223.1 MAG: hypothetical protein E6I84_10325 [Chloroflexota bacterium]